MDTSQVMELNIDISGSCNGKCLYSTRGSGRLENQGFMSVALYEKTLTHLSNLNLLPESKSVALYIWGEPFIHPQINDILAITAHFGLHAHISSNFLHLPELTPTSLHTISGTTLSLSGFTQTSYSHIHGGNLETVLENLNRYVQMIKQANATWKPFINWHCYRFNEIEREAAHTYFKHLGLGFTPSAADLNDFSDSISYFIRKDYASVNQTQIEEDLFTDFITECLRRGQNPDYICPQWSRLSLDAHANVLLCCTAPSPSMQNHGILGSIFDLSIAEIRSVYIDSPDCQICRAGGLAQVPLTQNTGFSINSYLQTNPHLPTLEQIAERVTNTHSRKKRTSSKQKQPLVSIGLASYNGGDFISKTIESLLTQNYDQIEINITDDISTDQTAEICRDYARRDSRIHFYPNPNNIGASLNYRRAFELCQGEYFIWSADHDIYHPDFITTLLPVLTEDPHVALCYPQTVLIDPQDKPIKLVTEDVLDTRGLEAPARFTKILQKLNACNMFHALYRTSALRQVRSYGRVIGSDHVILAELSLYGSIAQVKEPLFYRRQNRPPETFQQQIDRIRSTFSLSSALDFAWMVPFCYWGYEYLQIIHNSQQSTNVKENLMQEVRQCMRSRWGKFIDQEIDLLAALIETNQVSYAQPHIASLYALEFAHHINIARYFCAEPQRQATLTYLLQQILPAQSISSPSPIPVHQQAPLTAPVDTNQVEKLLQQGTELYQKNQFAEAERLFLQAQAISPQNINAAVSLGILYHETRRFEQSMEQFLKGVDIDPRDVDAWIGLGLVARQVGNQNLLNQVIEQITDLQPAHPYLARLRS